MMTPAVDIDREVGPGGLAVSSDGMGRGVLVHEWVERNGGAERVFDAMVGLFPAADVLCLWNDAITRYEGREVRQTWMADTPLRHHKAIALPLMPTVWRDLPGEYDWALVSSHLFAHHVTFQEQLRTFKKLAYVHTPARYLWSPDIDARANHLLPKTLGPSLRSIDRRRAQEVYAIATNSGFVRDRIRKVWDRDATVIYPPVAVGRIQSSNSWSDSLSIEEGRMVAELPRPFLLGASRFIPYKRLDLVIKAGEASGLPVVIAGAGPDEHRLRALAADATVPVTFVLRPSDPLLYTLYQQAMVFVFPAIEDFGIMPVEAMAAGTPVVAMAYGGASESVVDGQTGSLLAGIGPDELRRAVSRASAIGEQPCRRRAQLFSAEAFGTHLLDWIATTLGHRSGRSLPAQRSAAGSDHESVAIRA